MEYRKFGDTYIVRMDRDEEILAQLKIFAEKEQVKLASVTALGAVKDFTIGVFDTSAKAYHSNRFQGSMKSSPGGHHQHQGRGLLLPPPHVRR